MYFACANPTPEIDPKDAKAGGAAVVATGRSDYPNQINNVLAFPGIFRGTFDVHAKEINDEMKFAAATAIASIIPDDQIRADYIIPEAFNPVVAQTVAAAVAEAAKKSGVTREYKTIMIPRVKSSKSFRACTKGFELGYQLGTVMILLFMAVRFLF